MLIFFLDKIIAFFTSVGDAIGSWFGQVARLLNFMATQRTFLLVSVVAAVKTLYDFTVNAINDAVTRMEATQGGSEIIGDMSLPELLAFANSIIPLSEAMALAVALVEFYVACTIIKMILCFVPTIK